MNTIYSVHENTRDIRDAALVLVSIALVIALMAAGPQAGEGLSSLVGGFTAWGEQAPDAALTVGRTAAFAADERYWDTNCAHGWSAASACSEIARKVQSCRISLQSAYCSAYDIYIESLRK